MITIRKLLSLPRETRIRKLIQLIDHWEQTLETLPGQVSTILQYLSIISFEDLSSQERFFNYTQAVHEIGTVSEGTESAAHKLQLYRRLLHRIRFFLREEIGAEPAEWDFYSPIVRDREKSVPYQRTVFPSICTWMKYVLPTMWDPFFEPQPVLGWNESW